MADIKGRITAEEAQKAPEAQDANMHISGQTLVGAVAGLPLVPGVGGAYRTGHGDGKDARAVLGVPS